MTIQREIENKVSKERAKKLAKDLIKYATEESESFTIEGWCTRHGMIHAEIIDLAKEYDFFRQAYNEARERMGARIATGAVQGKYSPSIANRFISYYLRDLKEQEIEDYRAERAVDKENELNKMKDFASEIVNQQKNILE